MINKVTFKFSTVLTAIKLCNHSPLVQIFNLTIHHLRFTALNS